MGQEEHRASVPWRPSKLFQREEILFVHMGKCCQKSKMKTEKWPVKLITWRSTLDRGSFIGWRRNLD